MLTNRLAIGKRMLLISIAFYLLSATILAAGAAAQSDCPTGMLAYWKLDEAGMIIYEDSYASNTGWCVDGKCPVSVPGRLESGSGQKFDRVIETGVDVGGEFLDWGKDNSFSLEFWMKKESGCSGPTSDANEVIVGRDASSAGHLHWWVGVDCGSSPQGRVNFTLIDKNGTASSVSGMSNVADGRWHHVVAVRDGSTRQNSLFVDGKLENHASAVYFAGFDADDANLNIGWLNNGGKYRYTGVLDELAVYGRPLARSEILNHYSIVRDYCQTCSTPVRIMPLGDSITEGSASGAFPNDNDHYISYRKSLWDALVGEGYPVQFVGSQESGQAYDVEPKGFDPAHEGHPGARAGEMADQVYGWMVASEPDVVLLHIGTNDFDEDGINLDQSVNDVGRILDEIRLYSADTTVILARILKWESCSYGIPDQVCERIKELNDQVQAMAEARIADGERIILVDMENGAGLDYRLRPAGDMNDLLHPYATGYQKMAAVWLGALNQFAPECVSFPPAITSDPNTQATAGHPYSYRVKASGSPSPIFTLVDPPQGMTIDHVSGAISWVPGAAGDFPVTVRATNAAGVDESSYMIHVSPAPPCPNGMVGYWRLDETEGGPYDDFYDGHVGSCTSRGCPTPTSGILGGAQQFAGGTSGVGINAEPSAALNWGANSSFSIELWMKRSGAVDENDVIVGRDDPDPASNLHWWVGVQKSTGFAIFRLTATNGDTERVVGTTAVNDGEWHHVVAVRDAANGVNLIYVDGVLEGTTPKPSYTAGFGSSTAPLNIGWLSLSTIYSYDGALDELAVYSRALPAGEIEAHFNRGTAGSGYCEPGAFAPDFTSSAPTEAVLDQLYRYDVNAVGDPPPSFELIQSPDGMQIDPITGEITWTPSAPGSHDVVVRAFNTEGPKDQAFTVKVTVCPADLIAYWNFDETTGSTYRDSFNNFDAVCSKGCPSPAGGRVKGGQRFNGSTTGVEVPVDTAFDWAANDSFSIEYWMKKDAASSDTEVIVGRNDSGTKLHWWVGVRQGSPVAGFRLNATDGDEAFVSGTTELTDGKWHHIVAVRDAVNGVNVLYVDGVQEGSTPKAAYSAGFASSSAELNIGWMNLVPGYHYLGLLDEVALYRRALTAEEVGQHYAIGLEGRGHCQLAAPPVFTTHPAEQSVQVGASATFSVVVSGTMPITYKWKRDGQIIDGANGSTLTTTATTLADSGAKYQCIATNALDSTTSNTAALTVVALPPVIGSHPANVTVTEGGVATFAVGAAGTGPLQYQWKKNGAPIDGAASASYTTPATTMGDNGSQFVCEVKNQGGSVNSNAATLTVRALPPVIGSHPANVTVSEGSAATFAVGATGTGPREYQWKKNGASIDGATSASYTTPETTVRDHGSQYTCVVTNTGGSVTSNPATLNVNSSGISITRHPISLSVREGRTATLRVTARGPARTRLSYQWFRNGQAIAGATRTSCSIRKVSLAADDGAAFWCRVSSPAGSVRSNAAMLKVVPPRVRR